MNALVEQAEKAMREWAEAHGECDTQGIMDDEWTSIARAAVLALHHDSRMTHSICAPCYEAIQPGREPLRVLAEFRKRERCCACGRMNSDGIYYRADPADLEQCAMYEEVAGATD